MSEPTKTPEARGQISGASTKLTPAQARRLIDLLNGTPSDTLPTEDGAQIVPDDGYTRITATVGGREYTTRRATYDGMERVWVGVWRDASGDYSTYEMHPEHINPRTWTVDAQ